MPRVLIMSAPELVSELSGTVLWRKDVDRVFSAPGGMERVHAVRPDLVLLGGEDTAATLSLLRQIRADARTRAVSLGVVRRSVTLEEEEELRRAGANIIFGGQAIPYLWDKWLEELLNVPPRHEVRIPVSIAVWSHTAPGSEPSAASSLNVSVKGMLLETSELLDVGAKLDLAFTLPGHPPVRAVAQVVREEAGFDGRLPRLGVEFLILRDGARDVIRAFVEAGGR
ncbi:MAG TPA: PilZ domain-containing protein [Vicinamibacteria bacterium]|nr:PilZ domain-containing protein [Vicinamibacteria bacterium]